MKWITELVNQEIKHITWNVSFTYVINNKSNHRHTKLSVKESQQKYKDLYGNPDKIEPLSVPRLSRVIIKYQGWTLSSHKPTKWSQIFLDKMFQRLQLHRRIQGQRFFFHFNPLAAQSKPCQRRQAAVTVQMKR